MADAASPPEFAQPDLGPLERVWNLNGRPNLAMHLAILGRLVDRCTTRELAEFGLNTPRWRTIALLSLKEESTFGEVAAFGWLDRGDLSRTLRQLEADGLVQRRPNPDDGRSFLFALTEAGETARQGFTTKWRKVEAAFEGLFGPAELEQFNHGLALLASTCLELAGESD